MVMLWILLSLMAVVVKVVAASCPCYNGGTCNADRTCTCRPGYLGDDCRRDCGYLDLILVIDHSVSIGRYDWDNYVIPFITTLINSLPVDTLQARVGATFYTASAASLFQLDSYSTRAGMINKIKSDLTWDCNISPPCTEPVWNSNTTLAITEGCKLFEPTRGGRKDVTHVLVVITDGQSNSGNPGEAANSCRDKGVIMFAVGVARYDIDELRTIANKDPDETDKFVIIVPTFGDLGARLPKILDLTCFVVIRGCHSIPCQNGAKCSPTRNGYTCECPCFFTGSHCETRLLSPCRNGGSYTCISPSRYKCICSQGFTGRNCESIIPRCRSSPCWNGGTCIPTRTGYRCECPCRVTGSRCQTRLHNRCQNGATPTCVSSSEYKCICRPGFSGRNCESVESQTTCSCQNAGNCTGDGSCKCPPGYFGDDCGKGCGYVDLVLVIDHSQSIGEYAWDNYVIPFITELINSLPVDETRARIGATFFTATAAPFFEIDAFLTRREIINKIKTDLPWNCVSLPPCRASVWNANTEWGITEGCNLFDRSKGGRDDIPDVLLLITDGASNTGGDPGVAANLCRDNGVTVLAVGVSGYTMSELRTIANKDPYEPEKFIITAPTFRALSAQVPKIVDLTCSVVVGDCQSSPCSNGGTCKPTSTGYTCECPCLLTGNDCQTRHDNPCQNGATYSCDPTSGFTCICRPGFIGTKCQSMDSGGICPCYNGGTCSVDGQCDCLPGYLGYDCGKDCGKLDLILVIDHSESIGGYAWDKYFLPFIIELISSLPVDELKTRIGASVFTQTAAPLFELDDFRTRNGIINKIKTDLPWECVSSPPCRASVWNSNTAWGITEGCRLFDHSKGDRDNVTNVLLVITDGAANTGREPGVAANQCRDKGVIVIAVGVSGYRTDELRSIANKDPYEADKFVITVPTFHALNTHVPKIVDLMCSVVIRACQSNPCWHGGTCTPTDTGYACECPCLITGSNCETRLNNPCQNGGTYTCVSPSKYKCNCRPGYSGHNCDCNCGNVDLVLVIDHSQSIGKYFWENHVAPFITKMINALPVDEGKTRVGASVFTDTAGPLFELDDYLTRDDIIHKIKTDLPWNCVISPPCNASVWNSNTAWGITEGCILFDHSKGDRDNVTNVLLVITDGAANTGEKPGVAADRCRDKGVLVAALGVSGYRREELRTIANKDADSRDKFVITVSSFRGLSNYVPNILDLTCSAVVGDCKSNPCQNGGTCNPAKQGYICECPCLKTGSNCQTRQVNPCQHGGTYTCTSSSHYKCICRPGFSGPNCATRLPPPRDPCGTRPCGDNGNCRVSGNSYDCECHQGYYGPTCRIRTSDPGDPCATRPCGSHGTCRISGTSYRCDCDQGYSGSTCRTRTSNPSDPCATRPCGSHGTCRVVGTSYRCDCHQGYSGRNCRTRDPCATRPCGSHGTCQVSQNSYRCDCHQGYSGSYCQTRTSNPSDPCATRPCGSHGTCRVVGTSYRCDCHQGYSGRNCRTRDSCATRPCGSHGTCRVSQNSYRCDCHQGYSGSFCETRDPCATRPCGSHGTCRVSGTSYHCDCHRGYSGPTCQTRDPCATRPCGTHGTCRVSGTSYRCDCQQGYSGSYCEIRDPCATQPCGSHGTCRLSGTSYRCDCQRGYAGPTCRTWDPCSTRPCGYHGNCRVVGDSYRCDCHQGYSGSICQRRDPCATRPCGSHGTCRVVAYSYRCDCHQGYSGPTCRTRDPCATRPCGSHGTCRVVGTSYRCDCHRGYAGRTCRTRDPCATRPCGSHGKCRVSGTSYRCDCHQGYSGRTCRTIVPGCHNSPCQNGGTCRSARYGYTCQCPCLTTGSNCETRLLEWHGFKNPCQNGGTYTCVSSSGYKCNCPNRFSGRNCEIRVQIDCGKADIAFVLDASGSIGDVNWKKMINFTTDIVASFTVRSDAIRIGVISFSTTSNVAFDLSRYRSNTDVINAIGRIAYTGGSTITSAALRQLYTDMFTAQRGARAGVPWVAIVITDGNSLSESKTIQEANTARSKYIVLFAIGIGSQTNQAELKGIASKPSFQHVFNAQNFNALSAIESQVTDATCAAGKMVQRKCGKADIVFILDSSQSIGASNWDKILKFTADIVSNFYVRSDTIQVGVITFSSSATVAFHLNQHKSTAEVMHAAKGISYSGGSTETSAALLQLYTTMFTAQNGARPDVPWVGIVITDGHSQDKSTTIREANTAKSRNIVLFAIGIGNEVDQAELNAIANKPRSQYVFNARNFDALSAIEKQVIDVACDEGRRVQLKCGRADIVFILDSSGSIHASNWNKILKFTTDIISNFNIGPHTIQIGMISYSDGASVAFYLDKYSSVTEVINATAHIRYRGGATATDTALSKLYTSMFTTQYGARAGVPWVAVVISDGKSDSSSLTIREANHARNKEIAIFAVGIGNQVDKAEMIGIANKPSSHYVFNALDFDALSAIENKVIKTTCEEGKKVRMKCGKADIVFILDSSGSIGASNWNKMLKFTTDILSNFNVAPDTIQIGVISYSDSTRVAFYLDEYSSLTEIISATKSIVYSGGSTRTSGALLHLYTTMFSAQRGARAGVPWVAIVISDGESDSTSRTIQEANAARSKNIILFAIGIGNRVDQSEMNGIANKPSSQYVFNARNFDALSAIQNQVINATCDAGRTTPNGCNQNRCGSNGHCVPTSTAPYFKCNCRPCYEGQYCSTIKEKGPVCPCLNGGTCDCSYTRQREIYRCACPQGYYGRRCEQHDITKDETRRCGGPCQLRRKSTKTQSSRGSRTSYKECRYPVEANLEDIGKHDIFHPNRVEERCVPKCFEVGLKVCRGYCLTGSGPHPGVAGGRPVCIEACMPTGRSTDIDVEYECTNVRTGDCRVEVFTIKSPTSCKCDIYNY